MKKLIVKEIYQDGSDFEDTPKEAFEDWNEEWRPDERRTYTANIKLEVDEEIIILCIYFWQYWNKDEDCLSSLEIDFYFTDQLEVKSIERMNKSDVDYKKLGLSVHELDDITSNLFEYNFRDFGSYLEEEEILGKNLRDFLD